MSRSVSIIGAGQIGYAASHAFRDRGWNVTIHARTKPIWPRIDMRFERYVAGQGAPPTADVIVDTIAFDAGHVERYDPDRIGRLIVISSASVYCDAQGRTLDEAAQNGFPEFAGPISEDQSTVPPGGETYSTRKIRMEQAATALFGERVTILRPCAIYGPWSRHPREWWFVKRLLDGRRQIPLLHQGQSQFQPTDAADIGCFAVYAAEQSLAGVFNVSNEDCPGVSRIGEIIADFMRIEAEFVPVGSEGLIGRTPWSVPKPFRVSCKKMMDAGYDLPSVYDFSVCDAVDYLRELQPADWKAAFPQLAAYPWDLFDYDAEDAFFSANA